jgi:hypothetical protein
MAVELDEWEDPERPPVEATDLGSGVWVSWVSRFNRDNAPLIWHWCTAERWIAEGRSEARPRWMACGVGAHTLVARDPLHLEPSLLWPDCCGKHGFIREGRWREV